jgi:hypothetical protein
VRSFDPQCSELKRTETAGNTAHSVATVRTGLLEWVMEKVKTHNEKV